jgi:hypothetical protein
MFRFIGRSKPITGLLSAVVLASATLGPAAFVGAMTSDETYVVPHGDGIYDGASQNFWGGNASEIPRVVHPGAHASYGMGPMHAQARITTRMHTNTEPSAVTGSPNTAAVCDRGYRWDETAANGWTLPMPCSG